MHTIPRFLGLLALCSAAFISCQREVDTGQNLSEEPQGDVSIDFSLAFEEDEQTRTLFPTADNAIIWENADKLKVRQVCYTNRAHAQLRDSDVPGLKDGKYYVKASFTSITAADGLRPYQGKSGVYFMYQAFYPAARAEKDDVDVLFTLPDSQQPRPGSFDPSADLVISDQAYSKYQRTDGKKVFGLTFNRLSSIGVLTLKGLGSGVDVQKVEITSTDNPLAGTYTIGIDNKKDLSEGKYTISLDLASCKPADSNNFKVCFTCLPGTYKNVNVKVKTDMGTFSRTVGEMVFSQGAVTVIPEIRIRTVKTLMTYNVGIFCKSGAYKFDEIAQLLIDQDATFISLNEVDNKTSRTGGVDQLVNLKTIMENKLKAQLGSNGPWGCWYHFGPALDPYKGGQYGNGVISRDQVKKNAQGKYKYYHYQLTNMKDGKVVRFQKSDGTWKNEEVRSVSVLETPDCIFAATHLGLSAPMRVIHVAKLNEWFSTQFAGTTKPVFLCGDFNAEPGEVDELMSSHWTVLSDTNMNTHSTNKAKPTKCIDYICCWINPSAPEVRSLSRTVLYATDVPDIKTYSDHYPVKVVAEW